MNDLVPVIDQVLESLERGQIAVKNDREIRDALLVLRRLALEEQSKSQAELKPVKSTLSPIR